MTQELKPCPFCGGEAQLMEIKIDSNWWIVTCMHYEDCPVNPVGRHAYAAEIDAIDAWNTRAERTCKYVASEWAKTSFAHAGTSFCCSECGAHYVDTESYYAGLAGRDEEQIRTNYCPNCGAKVVR